MNKEHDEWEKEFDEKFTLQVPSTKNRFVAAFDELDNHTEYWTSEPIKAFIRENFIPKSQVERVLEKMILPEQIGNTGRSHTKHKSYIKALEDIRRELLGK